MATKLKAGSNRKRTTEMIARRSAELNVKRVPITSLNLWEDNPRKNEKAVPKLVKILNEHGQRTPIVVWKKNMVVYKGNTTLKAAMKLGWKDIAVILADFPSEAAATAYGIADNKSSEWSEWDEGVLAMLMSADEASFTPESTGFTEKELNGLKLSMEMPEGLEKTGVQGSIAAMGDFLVIQFENSEEFAEFKELLGLGKQERAINFDTLREFLK